MLAASEAEVQAARRIALVVLLVGCSGRSGGTGSEPPPGASGSGGRAAGATGGRGGGDPAGTGGAGPASGGPCVTREAFRSPLRRLTRVEYNNTVRDLLGDPSAPADRFPPDEISGGFANNAGVLTVSPLLAEKYQDAAEALAATAVKDLAKLVGCDPVRMGEEPCARQFIERFGRRAYRRPLAPAELDRLARLYAAGREGASFARGIEVTLRAMLQSPNFLYRLELGAPGAAVAGGKLVRLTPHEVAARLSYTLWASMPDDRLFAAADRGQLATPPQVGDMARTMLADARARPAVAEFYRQWLGLGGLEQLAKDAAVYPEFTDELRAGMRAELPALIEHQLWTADHKLGTLLTAPLGFATPALARLYGVAPGAGSAPARVTPPAAERAGLLTLPGVLAVHALPNQSSPVHRGKFVREAILCQELPPQPPNLMVTAPEVDPKRSTRERFAQHAKDEACAICHRLMDPIGFGFESYDGIGRFRAMDGGRAVDNAGELVETRDANGVFHGGRELGERLAKSGEVRDCLATQWYRFSFGRLDGPGDACSVQALREAFAASGGDLLEVLVALVKTEAFGARPPLPGEGAP
jgi:hypothetical protein